MASFGRDILVRLRLSDADFKGGLQRAQSQTQAFASGARSTLGGVASHWFAITAAVTGTAYAISRVVKPAMEWEAAQERMRVMARGNVTEFQRMRAAVERYSGDLFSKTQIANAYAMGGAVGFTGDQLDRIFPLLLRHADTLNMDVAQAMQDFAGAIQSGMERTIRFQGVQFDDIALAEQSARAYGKKFTALSDLEKQAVRYEVVVAQLLKMHGEERDGVDKLGDSLDRLKTSWSDLFSQGVATDNLAWIVDRIRDLVEGVRWLDEHLPLEISKGGITIGVTPEIRAERIQEEMQPLYDQLTDMTVPARAGKTAYDEWLEKFTEDRHKKREELEFYFRYLLTAPQDAAAYLGEQTRSFKPGLLGGKLFDPIEKQIEQERLSRKHGAESYEDLISAVHIQKQQERLEFERDMRLESLAGFEAYSGAMVSGWEAMYGAMNQAGSLFWNQENRRGRSLTHLAKYVAKESAAAAIEGIGEEAKTRAKAAMAMAGWFLAHGNFGSAAAMAANAAQWGAIAGGTAIAAGAIRGGAQRELAAIGAGSEPAPGEVRAMGGSTSITGRSDLSSVIARAPETVNISVTNVIERPIFFGTDPGAMQDFLDQFVGDYVRDGLRSQELAA